MAKLIIKTDTEIEEPAVEQSAEESSPENTTPPILRQKKKPPMNVTLNMRRGVDGRLMIYEHDHIDIVYLPDKMKLIAFAKSSFSDIVYETQNRLFNFLVKKGLCAPEQIRGGQVYGAIESALLRPKQDIPFEQLLILNIEKWIDQERPALKADEEYQERFTDMLTEPDTEASTELGEVPQEEEKGTIPKSAAGRYMGGWR